MDSDARPEYDPDAPVTHDHAGGVHHTHPYPGIDHDAADAQPVLDPEPIPNIVLHPGDVLAVAVIDNDVIVTLSGGRDGKPYAVLDCERNRDGQFIIVAIRFVAGGRGVLPVPPLPEPITVAGGNTIAVTGPLYGPYEYTLTHRHSHVHADSSPRDGELPHAHDHQHAGTAAASANAYGHATDPHTHQH